MATSGTTSPSHHPSAARGPRKTALARLSPRRPGSSRLARPYPPRGCIMGNVVLSSRPPAVPRMGRQGVESRQNPGRSTIPAGAVSPHTVFSCGLAWSSASSEPSPEWTRDPDTPAPPPQSTRGLLQGRERDVGGVPFTDRGRTVQVWGAFKMSLVGPAILAVKDVGTSIVA